MSGLLTPGALLALPPFPLSNYTKKGEKTKLGGKGEGGIYRCKHTGRDYVIKRIETRGYLSQAHEENFRSYDEVLAAQLLAAAGSLVPTMHLVEEETKQGHKKVFVASERILGARNLTAAEFKKLPIAIREEVLKDQIIHAWLCNRDTINSLGENLVIDQDKRIFHVDLGACLLSGFRRPNSAADLNFIGVHDTINFKANPVDLIVGEAKNDEALAELKTSNSVVYKRSNVKQLKDFFTVDSRTQQQAFLQGILAILQISDEQLVNIVNSSAHEAKDKTVILEGLNDRRQALIAHAQTKYGENSLQEEELSLQLRLIMHKGGIFQNMPSAVEGDARVSWHAQHQNAYKPNVRINNNNIIIAAFDGKKAQQILTIFQQLAIEAKLNSSDPKQIVVSEGLISFQNKIRAAVLADRLQILLGSHDFIAEDSKESSPAYSKKVVYKGCCAQSYRPKVSIESNSVGTFSTLEEKSRYSPVSVTQDFQVVVEVEEKIISSQKFEELLQEHYGLNTGSYTVSSGRFIIKSGQQFLNLVQRKNGARKTAVVSENKAGQVMAGKLLVATKGTSGFATAGGNSERPMYPKRAAAEEGADEFGYAVDEKRLTPLGSTVTSQTPNLFLAPPGATASQKGVIDYKEFVDGSIGYYSFAQFRQASQKNKAQFDRSSIHYYVKWYQRQVQLQLQQMGSFSDLIVICSKKPATLGQIFLKPSIANSGNNKSIQAAQQLEAILTSRAISFTKVTKTSKQSKVASVTRIIYQLDPTLNPALVLEKLQSPALTYTEQTAPLSVKPLLRPRGGFANVGRLNTISSYLYNFIILLAVIGGLACLIEPLVVGVLVWITQQTIYGIATSSAPSLAIIMGSALLCLAIIGGYYLARRYFATNNDSYEPVAESAPLRLGQLAPTLARAPLPSPEGTRTRFLVAVQATKQL